jgi:hypothetical protein
MWDSHDGFPEIDGWHIWARICHQSCASVHLEDLNTSEMQIFRMVHLSGPRLDLDTQAPRNWICNPLCPFCKTTLETALHLLAECRFSRQVWTLDPSGHVDRSTWPSPHRVDANTSTSEWWLTVTSIPDTPRKGLRSMTLLASWEIWKERNNCIFDRRESSVSSIVNRIKAEASLWIPFLRESSLLVSGRLASLYIFFLFYINEIDTIFCSFVKLNIWARIKIQLDTLVSSLSTSDPVSTVTSSHIFSHFNMHFSP